MQNADRLGKIKNEYTVVRKKTCKKITSCAKKEPKKPMHSSFIFLVDKLNQIKFNIFNIL